MGARENQYFNTIHGPFTPESGDCFSSSLTSDVSGVEKAVAAGALTLLNRFYTMDIDIDRIVLKSGNSLSAQEEFGPVLRCIGIISDITEMDTAASAESSIPWIIGGEE